jgi:hypothetical protein
MASGKHLHRTDAPPEQHRMPVITQARGSHAQTQETQSQSSFRARSHAAAVGHGGRKGKQRRLKTDPCRHRTAKEARQESIKTWSRLNCTSLAKMGLAAASHVAVKCVRSLVGGWAMYEIRLVKKDGTTTLIYVTTFLSEVRSPPPVFEKLDYDRAEIWLDGECIKTEYRTH